MNNLYSSDVSNNSQFSVDIQVNATSSTYKGKRFNRNITSRILTAIIEFFKGMANLFCRTSSSPRKIEKKNINHIKVKSVKQTENTENNAPRDIISSSNLSGESILNKHTYSNPQRDPEPEQYLNLKNGGSLYSKEPSDSLLNIYLDESIKHPLASPIQTPSTDSLRDSFLYESLKPQLSSSSMLNMKASSIRDDFLFDLPNRTETPQSTPFNLVFPSDRSVFSNDQFRYDKPEKFDFSNSRQSYNNASLFNSIKNDSVVTIGSGPRQKTFHGASSVNVSQTIRNGVLVHEDINVNGKKQSFQPKQSLLGDC